MNYKVNKDKSFIEKGGGAGNRALPDYSEGYGVPKKGRTTLPDNTEKAEKPKENSSEQIDVTDNPKYSKSKKEGKRVYKNSITNQITTHEKVKK